MHPAFAVRCAVGWASVAIGASGCFGGTSGGASSARSNAAPEHIRVTSTLAGLDVAPNHVHWVAEPSLKKVDVREVRFYVDGELSWIDPKKPYMYGGDGGYLVTTWLSRVGGDGLHVPAYTRHTFTTEAVAVDGSQSREEVVLRVPSVKHQPVLPYGILGSPVGGPPWPRLINVITPGILWIGAPLDNATAYEIEADGATRHPDGALARGRLRILAPIRIGPGGTGVTLLGWHFDNYDCSPGGPFAVYAWKFDSHSRLHLTALRDPCAARRQKLEGTWEGAD
jgi:hypothetical protein